MATEEITINRQELELEAAYKVKYAIDDLKHNQLLKDVEVELRKIHPDQKNPNIKLSVVLGVLSDFVILDEDL